MTTGSDPKPDTASVFMFAVDWDGTCVEAVWPELGDWLPGAVDGLRRLDAIGKVVIHTCRVAPWEFDARSEWRLWRDPRETQSEIDGVRRMLDEQGLGHIEVWTRDFKPPALVYIDDRGYRFDGDWDAAATFAESLNERAAEVNLGAVVLK